jgi:endonuclease G, mitochondrial
MRKLLLLLGAARYPRRGDLALPAFPVAHAAFKAAMIEGHSPIVAPEDCLDLFDDDSAWVNQQSRVDEWLGEKRREAARPEALILYYVGHGGIEKGEQVYLTINSTNKLDPYFSSVPRDSLAKLLRFSASDYRKFLILDCCFAASIIKTLQSSTPIQDKMNLELREVGKAVSKPDSGGLAALCASSSLASANANGRDGLTQFTDGLLCALRAGDPSSPSDLSFETVRALLERQLHEHYGVEAVPPSSYFADDFYEPVHQLPLFPNRAKRPPDIFSPRTLRPDAKPRGEADAALQMATGNPSRASQESDNYLLERPQFAASFNCSKGRPNWVSWHFRYADLGKVPRTAKWLRDPLLPGDAGELSPALLAGSGFDRGHLCPPHNRAGSESDNQAVFRMSNVVAQSPVRNQKLWLGFETFCRQLVEQRQCDLYLISGPLGALKIIANGRIEVPAALWKIVLCVPEGHVPGAETRIAEAIAIRMNNHERAAITEWTEAMVTISSIEDETGYTFFEEMPSDLAALLKRRQVTQRTAEVILAQTG